MLFLGEVKVPPNFDVSIFGGADSLYSIYASDRLNWLDDNTLGVTDKDELISVYANICKAFADEVPIVPICFLNNGLLTGSNVIGNVNPAWNNEYGNIAEWFVR